LAVTVHVSRAFRVSGHAQQIFFPLRPSLGPAAAVVPAAAFAGDAGPGAVPADVDVPITLPRMNANVSVITPPMTPSPRLVSPDAAH